VFFLSEQHLLGGAEGVNLYEYDFNAARGERVALIAPNALGVARISEDGSRIYFVAQGRLTSAANPLGDVAQPTEADNLYMYDTGTGEVSFVGELSAEDAADWQVRDERPVDASPDGRFLVFDSSADLTHSGTSGVSQVFEYDTVAKSLVLVSRVQGGAGGVFPASIVFPNYTGNFDPSPQPSSVSDDGSVVVFESEAALTPHALAGYGNVYEYRNGVLSLISDGQDRSHRDGGASSVSLVGVDGSGRDIFFTTADPLVPQDGDTQEDVYDARIEGGFLPSATAECKGEGCQGPLAPSLPDINPVSFGQIAGEQVAEPPPTVKMKIKSKAKHKVKKAKRRKKARGAHRKAGQSIKKSKRL
jgi:Tol biopolymer transport system component